MNKVLIGNKEDKNTSKTFRLLLAGSSRLIRYDNYLFYCFIRCKISVSISILPMKHFHLELVVCPLTFSIFHFDLLSLW